jgi:lipopolysaccharide export system protein LptA
MKIFQSFIPLILLFVCTFSAFGQGKITIKQADTLQGGKNAEGEPYRKLIGDVILEQGNTRIYGDSVILYPQKNISEVFGERVRVEEGDSITVIGDRLIYDGNKRVAEMRNEVIYRDPSMTLYTDNLDYDLKASLAYYYNGGRLVDTTNVLTSEAGSYNTLTNMASFKDSVVLINPDYTLESDTLQYNTATQIAYTLGPTVVTSNDGTELYAEAGSEYNTNEKQSIFGLGTIETEDYVISADQLFFDDVAKFYRATANVEMVAKENNVIITGDSAIYRRNEGITKVFGKAVMKKPMELDTLYLSADTLVSIEDSIPANERILAYHDVRIYRSDLQALSDSLAYHITDSILYFFQNPIIWNGENQIVADSINVEIIGGQVKKMNTIENSFVISEDTIKNYNQVKGRKMIAYFEQGNISKIDVNGNGESIYFALEQDTILVGMNKIIGSDLKIEFTENQVSDIRVYVKPQASFFPPHEINDDTRRLADFSWRAAERPSKVQVIQRTELQPKPQEDDNKDNTQVEKVKGVVEKVLQPK